MDSSTFALDLPLSLGDATLTGSPPSAVALVARTRQIWSGSILITYPVPVGSVVLVDMSNGRIDGGEKSRNAMVMFVWTCCFGVGHMVGFSVNCDDRWLEVGRWQATAIHAVTLRTQAQGTPPRKCPAAAVTFIVSILLIISWWDLNCG